jgi:hypothetical protein
MKSLKPLFPLFRVGVAVALAASAFAANADSTQVGGSTAQASVRLLMVSQEGVPRVALISIGGGKNIQALTVVAGQVVTIGGKDYTVGLPAGADAVQLSVRDAATGKLVVAATVGL